MVLWKGRRQSKNVEIHQSLIEAENRHRQKQRYSSKSSEEIETYDPTKEKRPRAGTIPRPSSNPRKYNSQVIPGKWETRGK